jgi:L-lactate dehydrogenase complex protein LldG
MSTTREPFLQRIRQALQASNRPGQARALENRGSIGYQGAGADPALRFRDEFTGAGGDTHLVTDRSAAVEKVLELARNIQARRILLGCGACIDSLALAEPLRALGSEVHLAKAVPETSRDTLFAADLAVTGVDFLIAETGSLIVVAAPEEPRSLSLLPPVHIAVAERGQLVPDLFDLFAMKRWTQPKGMPSCLTLITGPSKTGDIELKLVTGVHGPGEVHVVLVCG